MLILYPAKCERKFGGTLLFIVGRTEVTTNTSRKMPSKLQQFYEKYRKNTFFCLFTCIFAKKVVPLQRILKNNSMKQVHMGGYSIVIPENYVHRVKVSRVNGSRDVRLRLAKGEQSASVTGAFAEYPCWESDLH